jgi:hypothetical protein
MRLLRGFYQICPVIGWCAREIDIGIFVSEDAFESAVVLNSVIGDFGDGIVAAAALLRIPLSVFTDVDIARRKQFAFLQLLAKFANIDFGYGRHFPSFSIRCVNERHYMLVNS